MMSSNVIVEMVSGFLVELPSPGSISYMWNFGSMLAFCLGVQIITGLFLSFHYSAHVDMSFLSLIHIARDVNYGWLMHFLHANGASLFFVCLYIHVGRGLYYSCYNNFHVWMTGIVLFFLVMMTAFLGYVLPWGQMSFWGATVITNLLYVIPYFGGTIVEWLWGGFSVNNPTLVRFFALHFLMPFVVVAMAVVHLLFLHEVGSSSPLGLSSDVFSVEFHPYFGLKDVFGLGVLVLFFMIVVCFYPNLLGDSENFMSANFMSTPEHIQPEWYFLFAYAILRSIPNKMGGVVGLVMSISIMFFCVLWSGKVMAGRWVVVWKYVFWYFVVIFILLTWIGARPVESPYVSVGQALTVLYFLDVLLLWAIHSAS